MARKGSCPRCSGSIWKYVRNGEYVSRCGNCGWEPDPSEAEPQPIKKKLEWEPVGDFLKEEPEPEPEVVEEPPVEDEMIDLTGDPEIGLPLPEDILTPEEEPVVENTVEDVVEEVVVEDDIKPQE